MAIVMVALLAFGGTYAYFTAQAGAANGTAFTGKIALTTNDTFTIVTTNNDKLLPTETLVDLSDTDFEVTDASNRASYIFFQYSIEVFKKEGEGYASTATATDISAVLEAADITSNNSLTAVALPDVDGVFYITTTDEKVGGVYTIALDDVTIPAEWGNEYQEAKIVVNFAVKSIQVVGFTGANAAWEALNA